MRYHKCGRLLSRIDEAFKEHGKNRIFLLGNNLNDIFFRDLKSGAYGIVENLKDYFLNSDEFNWFVYVPSNINKIEIYKKNKNKILKLSNNDEFFEQKLNNNAKKFIVGSKEKTLKEEKNDEIAEKVNSATDTIENKYFERICERLFDETTEGEIFVYFENFDWLAEFYNEQEINTIYIKKILELDKLKKNLVVASLKQMEVLKNRFFYVEDEKEVLNIGTPSKKEIELTLYRVSWKKTGGNLANLDYEMLSAQLSNANYSLRESVKLFKKKLQEHGETLKLEDFKLKSEVEEKVLWDDIILDTETKNRIMAEVENFIQGEYEMKKGAILTGPPGTGKTFIAKAIANEGKVYFMCPKLSDLKGQYVGQSAPKVKNLFEEARQNEPTLIFLDEVDTLFPLRDSEDGDSYTKDITNEFLQQLDGVNTGTQKIFVLAATNRIEAIDPAVRSRLGNPINIDLPREDEREILFKKYLKGILPDKFWSELPHNLQKDLKKRSAEMSGRDIKNFCSLIEKILKEKEINFEAISIYECFKRGFRERKRSLIEKLKNTTGVLCLNPSDIVDKKLIGIEKVKKKIANIVKQVTTEHRKLRERYNLELLNGILLYGPPGNGKTELVEEVAKEGQSILIKIESKDVIGYSTKETLKNLDTIFLQTIQLSKVCEEDEGVILFFDEFDSLVGTEMTSTLRGTILSKLSDRRGIRSSDSKIILIGATNFYGRIDEAVKRKGRFDEALYLGNPGDDIALKLIEQFFNKEKMYLAIKDDENVIKEFYDKIKNFECEKNKLNNISSQNEGLSSSFLKSEVISLKRFIIDNREVKEKIAVTKEDIENYYLERGI